MEQYEALAREEVIQRVQGLKDKCFKDTNNAQDFAICGKHAIGNDIIGGANRIEY
jgi:hypothetical protein